MKLSGEEKKILEQMEIENLAICEHIDTRSHKYKTHGDRADLLQRILEGSAT